jgi:hypothetical protein
MRWGHSKGPGPQPVTASRNALVAGHCITLSALLHRQWEPACAGAVVGNVVGALIGQALGVPIGGAFINARGGVSRTARDGLEFGIGAPGYRPPSLGIRLRISSSNVSAASGTLPVHSR